MISPLSDVIFFLLLHEKKTCKINLKLVFKRLEDIYYIFSRCKHPKVIMTSLMRENTQNDED